MKKLKSVVNICNKQVPYTEEGLIDVKAWTADIKDIETNIKSLTPEIIKNLIHRNLKFYSSKESSEQKCDVCYITNRTCKVCPVRFFSEEAAKLDHTICRYLIPTKSMSNWNIVGLMFVEQNLNDYFHNNNENIEKYKTWALKNLKLISEHKSLLE